MQKKRASSFAITGFVVILAVLFLVAYHQVHKPPNKPAPSTHTVLIVDFNNNKTIDQEQFINSKDAILAAKSQDKITKNTTDHLFNGLSALEKLDVNKDNKLNMQDPIFPALELVFLTDGGKGRKYVPLTEAGIVSIVFYKEALRKVDEPEITKKSNLVGYAIKTNGEKCEIRAIPIRVGK